MSVPTKVCNECNQTLYLHEFGFSPSKNYHFPKCKKCTNEKRGRWYKKDQNLGKHHPWKRSIPAHG